MLELLGPEPGERQDSASPANEDHKCPQCTNDLLGKSPASVRAVAQTGSPPRAIDLDDERREADKATHSWGRRGRPELSAVAEQGGEVERPRNDSAHPATDCGPDDAQPPSNRGDRLAFANGLDSPEDALGSRHLPGQRLQGEDSLPTSAVATVRQHDFQS